MTQPTSRAVALILFALVTLCASPTGAQTVQATGDHHAYMPMTQSAPEAQEKYAAEDRAFELEVLRLINVQRAANRLPPLAEDAALTQAARRHTQDMARNQFFSHTGSDNSTDVARMLQEGYTGSPYGEVIAAGQPTPSVVVDTWINSPVHRPILLAPNVNEFGAGFASNSQWFYKVGWGVVFGRR